MGQKITLEDTRNLTAIKTLIAEYENYKDVDNINIFIMLSDNYIVLPKHEEDYSNHIGI